jgi:beta-glucanase (GH16 family)
MRRLVVVLVAAAAALWLTPARETRAKDPPPEGWKLTWSDEFDGTEIDRKKWDFDIGNGFYNYDANQWIAGWGNGELQYYTKESDNAFVKDGVLHIRAIKESLHGCGYTSARLKTRKKDGSPLFNQAYGRFEFRAKQPTGAGVWPALWMLPQEEKYGGWPTSGEIDVMEARGADPSKVLGTLHYGSKWPANTHTSHDYVFPRGTSVTDWHVYAVEWEPGEIRWLVDGKQYATQSFWWASQKTEGGKGVNPKQEADLLPWPAPFDHPYYLVMNVAVGGNLGGKVDKATVFPAEMLVDYVRVYEKAGGYGKPKPRADGPLPFGKR